jgi:hypothetical protein
MYHFKIYGNDQILSLPKIAVHASRATPDSLLEAGQKLFKKLTETNIALAGGWQSMPEKALLRKFNPENPASLMLFIAKSFSNYTLPPYLNVAYSKNKIAIIEPDIENPRIDLDTVDMRDRILDDLINHHLFLYLQPGGRLEERLRKLHKLGKEIFVFNVPSNRRFFIEGIVPIDHKTLDRLIF